MSEQHKISEYIEKMSFKKKLGMGFSPDEVYEAICELTSMYNDVLAKSYQEVSELRSELDKKEQVKEVPKPRELPPLQKPAAPIIKEVPPVQKPQPRVEPVIKESAPVQKPAAPAVAMEPQRANSFTYQSVPNNVPEPPKVSKDERTAEQLKHVSRQELLEILLESRKENEKLSAYAEDISNQNKALIEQLKDKQVKINKAGTLAEATFALNGVFDSVSLAAQQYLDNLSDLYEREQRREDEALAKAQLILDDASAQCEKLIKDTTDKCLAMEVETRTNCDVLKNKAKAEADQYWQEVSVKLESFYQAHEGLKELLQGAGKFPGGDAGR